MRSVVNIKEDRLRRMAGQQGMSLVASKESDPQAQSFGHFSLIDKKAGSIESRSWPPERYASLEEIEVFLARYDGLA